MTMLLLAASFVIKNVAPTDNGKSWSTLKQESFRLNSQSANTTKKHGLESQSHLTIFFPNKMQSHHYYHRYINSVTQSHRESKQKKGEIIIPLPKKQQWSWLHIRDIFLPFLYAWLHIIMGYIFPFYLRAPSWMSQESS